MPLLPPDVFLAPISPPETGSAAAAWLRLRRLPAVRLHRVALEALTFSYSSAPALSVRKVYIAFVHRAWGATVLQKVDYLFVRKYASQDPATNVGAEEPVR